MDDRRRFKRVPAYLIGHLKKTNTRESDVSEELIVRNISSGGVFIETLRPFENGDLVSFDLTLPGERYRLKIVGVVRWKKSDSEPYGIGIEFIKVTTEDRKQIDKYIDEHSDNIE